MLGWATVSCKSVVVTSTRVRAAAACVLVLFLAEAVARTVHGSLPPPRRWQSVEADVKVSQMDDRAEAEVVLVGSSVVNGGADPQTLESTLDRSVYNAALSAGFVPVMEQWTTHVVFPRLQPDVMVHGLISFDLYDAPNHSVFVDGLLDSPGGRRAVGNESLLDAIDRKLETAALWRHRSDLRDPMLVLRAGLGHTIRRIPEFGPIGRDGRAVYEFERAPGDAGGPPIGSWTLGDDAVESLRREVRTAVERGIEPVLVVMPVSQRYVDRHPGGEEDQRRFRAVVEALASAEGAGFIDLDVLRDPSWYLDQVHLGPDGAAVVSDALGEELLPLLDR